ncbi:MAG TPA: hypothetical protein VHO69_17900 [Phototrophicaceae bacterium]|nr:hypothetical protein [Phototrophicaceae bacterium]
MYKFNNRQNAFEFANRCTKIMLVLLGDDGLFWVTAPAQAERLHRQGYQYAE